MSKRQPPYFTIEPPWWNVVSDPGDDAFNLEYLDDDLQAAYDELHVPDPQLIVRTLYGNHPGLDRDMYRPLVRRARLRWWPHLEF